MDCCARWIVLFEQLPISEAPPLLLMYCSNRQELRQTVVRNVLKGRLSLAICLELPANEARLNENALTKCFVFGGWCRFWLFGNWCCLRESSSCKLKNVLMEWIFFFYKKRSWQVRDGTLVLPNHENNGILKRGLRLVLVWKENKSYE